LDTDRPTVQVTSTVTEPTNQSPIPITITFSEDVIGMQLSDLLIENGTASSLLGSGNIYTAQITPSGNGIVRLRLGYGSVMDAAANAIDASSYYTWTYDGTSPTVEITSTETTFTNTSPIPITITFSEAVTGLTASDITVANGAVSNFNTADNITYTADIIPSAQGIVTVDVAAGVSADATGNVNTAATTLTRTYDSITPTVVISSATSSSTNVTPIPVTITFSENVTGFTINDITVINGVAGGFVSLSGSVYTALITPAGNGEVIVDVLADTASDLGGNSNSAALSLTRIFDSIRPTVIISSSVSDYTINSLVALTITFSKNITGFDINDIVISNGNASNFTPINNTTYTVDIIAVNQGNITVNIPDAIAQDTAGNSNTAATELAYIYDNQTPVVNSTTEISVDVTDTESIRFSWDAATDNISSASNLLYKAYYSIRDDIGNLTDILSNGIAINDWSDDMSVTATGLSASTIYYINVIVKDETGNMSAYSKVTGITDDEEEVDEDIPLPNNTVITVDGQEQEAANIKRETTQGVTRITVTVDDFLVSNLMQSEEEGTV
ncbi:MAG TPA: Ig-like domain-containing protein, partial [Clostridia bacterium]|nr:Ig-like domain-containing protein [Clostridia bacterium]